MLAAGTGFFFWFMGFWGELLWFDSLTYGDRFWGVFLTRVLAGSAGFGFALVFMYFLTMGGASPRRPLRFGAVGLAVLVGLSWGVTSWESILRFIHAAPTTMTDPIFGHAVGFYLFHLPLYHTLEGLLLILALIALAAAAADAFLSLPENGGRGTQLVVNIDRIDGVYRSGGVLLLVLALGRFLARYDLLYSELGAVTGPGWTDIHVRLPALTAMTAVMVLVGAVLIARRLRRRLMTVFHRRIQR